MCRLGKDFEVVSRYVRMVQQSACPGVTRQKNHSAAGQKAKGADSDFDAAHFPMMTSVISTSGLNNVAVSIAVSPL